MLIYAIAIIPLLLRAVSQIEENHENAKAVAFADDITGAGKISGLKVLWDFIYQHGPEYGYYPQPTKTWLIVKSEFQSEAERIFIGTDVKITTEVQKHLGAVIGSKSFKREFITVKVKKWMEELSMLSKVAKFAPHESYVCFTSGYKHKISYLMRTIPDMKDHLKPIDDLIATDLIPSITGGILVTPNERLLFSLPPSMGGLGIPIFSNKAHYEFSNSLKLTTKLQDNIELQIREHDVDLNASKKIKGVIQQEKRKRNETTQSITRSSMDANQKRTRRDQLSERSFDLAHDIATQRRGIQHEQDDILGPDQDSVWETT